jgi:hypothetical protein
MPPNFQEAAPRQGADFRAPKSLEQFDAPVQIFGARRCSADEDQFRWVGRVSRGVGQRHHAAERRAQDNRIDDAKRLAERMHVVAPLREIPARARAVLAAAIAAMVEIDDLGNIGQSRIGRPVDRVIGAGAAMQHQQHRLFPHQWAVGNEFRALDIEEQPHPVHGYVHGQIPFIPSPSSR